MFLIVRETFKDTYSQTSEYKNGSNFGSSQMVS